MGFNHDRKISDRLKDTNAIKIPKYYWTAFCYPNMKRRWGMNAVSFVFIARNLDPSNKEFTIEFNTVKEFDGSHFQSRAKAPTNPELGDHNSVFAGDSPLARRCQYGQLGPHFEQLKRLTAPTV